MGTNRGKQFENIVRECFEKIDDVNVIRLHDQMTGYKGSKNPCDLIVYKYPYHYALELKSVHGNTFPLTNITPYQYSELLRMSKLKGVFAGLIIWWVDKDITKYVPIEIIDIFKKQGLKSIPSDIYCNPDIKLIEGVKKRVFWEYDFTSFFREVENGIR